MKVLWICNVPTPEAHELMGDNTVASVSWLTYMSELLSQDVDLYYCYLSNAYSKIREKKGKKIHYIAIPASNLSLNKYDSEIVDLFECVLKEISPHVVHIWGTEFPRTYCAMCAIEKIGMLDTTVISIQGLVHIYARHFCEGLPQNTIHGYTIRHLLKHDNLAVQQKQFHNRGLFEVKSLQLAKHIIGRTDWDHACASRVNPSIQYHHNNETLRPGFYSEHWSYKCCEPYRIFMSQGGYPIKGLHYAIEAVAEVKKIYPHVQLYIAGSNLLDNDTITKKIKEGKYAQYIRKLIKKYNLDDIVHFTGVLDEGQMLSQYKKANVFIMPSTIENSPNSMGEAMLLGMPIVVSDVGGVKDLLQHNKEGYIYQSTAPYMLAYYIKKIFAAKEEVKEMCDNAHAHACVTHDATNNKQCLINIYERIISAEERSNE